MSGLPCGNVPSRCALPCLDCLNLAAPTLCAPNFGLASQIWHETIFDELEASAYRCKVWRRSINVRGQENEKTRVFCNYRQKGFLWHLKYAKCISGFIPDPAKLLGRVHPYPYPTLLGACHLRRSPLGPWLEPPPAPLLLRISDLRFRVRNWWPRALARCNL